MNKICSIVALLAAAALAAVGFFRGTYAAGGSDSSCYALMADAFASGKLQPSSALALQAPWPDAPKTFAPGGFVPSQSDPSAAAPVCAPGFSLLLAPVVKLGGPSALFGVTPVAGAMLVWMAYLAGRALGGPPAGAMSAVLVAASPIVLFQVVQPMNDITTAALWMAAFVALISRRWMFAGICCGLALLVRPNLLPLAIVSGLYVVFAQPKLRPTVTRSARSSVGRDFSRAIGFGLAALPFVLIVMWLNAKLYGGPLRSGYGQLNSLFSLANIPANAVRYSRWLRETQTPFVVLGFFAPLGVDRERRAPAWLAVALIATTALVYFAYTPFDDWSYLRFLLPAIVLLIVLMSVAWTTIWQRTRPNLAYVSVGVLTLILASNGIVNARERFAFQMRVLEQRYRSASIVVRDRLPRNAVLLTVWDSGAVRFHAGKEAVVWEGLDPGWLDRGLAWLAANGHPPYILLESWEEPKFRERFAAQSPIGHLDWPPKYEVDRVVRIYDPADRERDLKGQRVATEFLWPELHRR